MIRPALRAIAIAYLLIACGSADAPPQPACVPVVTKPIPAGEPRC